MGHLMRCLAIAEEAVGRGWAVSIAGDLSEAARRIATETVPEVVLAASVEAADVVHIDTYADVALPERSWLVSNMQDGPFGVRGADLAIDANLGAETRFVASAATHALVGISAVPIRSAVQRARAAMRRASGSAGTSRVLVVLGGTDPFGLTPAVVESLAAVTGPLDVTVVTPDSQRAAVERAAASSRHHVRPVPFLADLPAVAVEQDLVISASGTSVWDFACMGVPMALICVTDNQVAGYRTVLDEGLALGLGEPPHRQLVEHLGAVDVALRSPEVLAELRARGQERVDGLGAWRIVSAWEQLLDVRDPAAVDTGVTVRRATAADARLLHEWRNDPTTRQASRSSDEVAWDDHVRWVDRVLGDPARQLYVAEQAGAPIGTVRWDRLGGGDWEVSITVAPQARGRGLAVPLLRAGEDALQTEGGARLIATVHVDNVPSRRLFERAGYLPLTPPDGSGFATSVKWRPATAGPTSAASRG
jgi:spore coat polysaccharide biosynthesis predicted glycosyltransferase SpsG/RimJ/RimL family protein N-acetyltransferase